MTVDTLTYKQRTRHRRVWLWLLICLLSQKTLAASQFILPKYHLNAEDLAIIVNDADPLSVAIGNYYREARAIPAENLLHIRFKPGRANFSPENFLSLKKQLDATTPKHIQAYALTWIAPYRVGCMSMTSAFTFGYDKKLCAAKSCDLTYNSPYFNHIGSAPYDELGIRPSMVLAASTLKQAKALIDRGIAADDSQPPGTAYLVSTTNRARNVRHRYYPAIAQAFQDRMQVEIVKTPKGIRDRQDVLFYFTGIANVPYLETLKFLPGAMADHLTSGGGVMLGGRQMSVLRWLEAGATGSYGTVKEPCNHLQKFPNPGIAMEHYLRGETLIEAYWKSVQQPVEGIFVGDPLARPFGGHTVTVKDDITTLHTRSLAPGMYKLRYSPTPIGPYQDVPTPLQVPATALALQFKSLPEGYYEVIPVTPAPAENGAGSEGKERIPP